MEIKNQIQHDLIDNMHNPNLEQNLTIALDDLINCCSITDIKTNSDR